MNAFLFIVGILAAVISFPDPTGLVYLILCLIAVWLDRRKGNGRMKPKDA